MDRTSSDSDWLLSRSDRDTTAISSFSAVSAEDVCDSSPVSPPAAYYRRIEYTSPEPIDALVASRCTLPPYEASGQACGNSSDDNHGLGISTLQREQTCSSSSPSLNRYPSFKTFITESFRTSSAPSILPFVLPDDYPTADPRRDSLGAPDLLYERIRNSPRLLTTFVLIALSVFSTVFSAIYLFVAAAGPIYSGISHTGSSGLTVSAASTVVALFAKLIELSFITVFTAFIGQLIWRQAYAQKHGRGMTLAQLSMRNWITQPGAVMTNPRTFRYGVMSLLGLLSLLGAISAMLYTTASNSLVSPQLKFGNWKSKVMAGLVQTTYANDAYIQTNCQTPITTDSEYGGATCIEIEHVSQSYPNFKQYLTTWTTLSSAGNVSTNQQSRPRGTATINNATSLVGTWIDVENMEAKSLAAGRIIQNVSYALPHAGVYQAASWAHNEIPQPDGLEGLNAFSLYASVPSPVIHVLCVNISVEELAPMIYSTWPNAQTPVNTTIWPEQVPRWTPTEWLNATAVDDIFEFGPKYGERRPPMFPYYPGAYNTMLNATGVYEGRDAIYLLAKGGPLQGGDYSLCSLKSSITPFCSTRMNATSVGAAFESHCEDEHDELQYIKSNPEAYSGSTTINLDWVDVAADWGLAMSLNDGLVGSNSSTARILAELIPQSAALSSNLPSLAETLAVMAGCTAVIASQNASFVPFWNYTSPDLAAPIMQYFNASYITQQYAAGGGASNAMDAFQSDSAGQSGGHQKAFYVVLIAVFVGNAFVLVWFLLNIVQRKWVVDLSEPADLFNLAIYSPAPPPTWRKLGRRSRGKSGGARIVTAKEERKRKKAIAAEEESALLTRNWVINDRGKKIVLEECSPSSVRNRTPKQTMAELRSTDASNPAIDSLWFEHRRNKQTGRLKRFGVREKWRNTDAEDDENDAGEGEEASALKNKTYRRRWWWPFPTSSVPTSSSLWPLPPLLGFFRSKNASTATSAAAAKSKEKGRGKWTRVET